MSTYNVGWAISRISILLYKTEVQLDTMLIIVILYVSFAVYQVINQDENKTSNIFYYVLACKHSLFHRHIQSTQNFIPYVVGSVCFSK